MADELKLLVVDDEEQIGLGCRRIFSREGFEVDTTVNPLEGLKMAEQNEYAAILLDMKMPQLTGIEFLQRLREFCKDVPVIVMTGFPSVPNAVTAAQHGISEYVSKPFTPAEITTAAKRAIGPVNVPAEETPAATGPVLQPGDYCFYGEVWCRADDEGAVRAGAMVPRPEGVNYNRIRLPKVGETVQQGQPMAAFTIAGKDAQTVPAPVTGVVIAINQTLEQSLAPLWDDPCGDGWIACIAPKNLAADIKACSAREVILATGDDVYKTPLPNQLAAAGCKLHIVTEPEKVLPLLQEGLVNVLMIDAAALGEAGPELALQAQKRVPQAKTVVIGTSDSKLERVYRTCGIFYYTVEPFADREIIEILHAVFPKQQAEEVADADPTDASNVTITTANGESIRMPLSDLKLI